jgi:hypothetical protein
MLVAGHYVGRDNFCLKHCNLESDMRFKFDIVEVTGLIVGGADYDVTLFKVASMINFLEALTKRKVFILGIDKSKRLIREESGLYLCRVHLYGEELREFLEYLFLCVLPQYLVKFGFFSIQDRRDLAIMLNLNEQSLFFGLGKELVGKILIRLAWTVRMSFSHIQKLLGFSFKI